MIKWLIIIGVVVIILRFLWRVGVLGALGEILGEILEGIFD